MLVLIGCDDPTLEVHHESVHRQEVCSQDGLPDVLHLKVPDEAAVVELERRYPGPIADYGSPSGSDQVVPSGSEVAGLHLGD